MVTQIRDVYVYIQVHVCTHNYLEHTSIYIYIYREREGDVEIYTYAHIPIYIYIYMNMQYIHIAYVILTFLGLAKMWVTGGCQWGPPMQPPGLLTRLQWKSATAPLPILVGLASPSPEAHLRAVQGLESY